MGLVFLLELLSDIDIIRLSLVNKTFNDMCIDYLENKYNSHRFINNNEDLRIACKHGHLYRLIHYCNNNLNWNHGLEEACEYGHIDVAKFLIYKGANDFDGGLIMACYGGNHEIVDLMIYYGANDFNGALMGACEYLCKNYGEQDHILCDLMISLGADKCWNCYNGLHSELKCLTLR